MARQQSHALDQQNRGLLAIERKLRSYIQVLELERTAYLSTITSLRHLAAKNSSKDTADGLLLADIDQEVASLLEMHDQAASVVDSITLKIPVAAQNSSVSASQKTRPSSANCWVCCNITFACNEVNYGFFIPWTICTFRVKRQHAAAVEDDIY